MSLIARKDSESSFTPAPAGAHIARCVQVIDLGTQKSEWEGKVKVNPKVRLVFELPTETHVFKDENGPEPFLVGREYTLSLGERAALRHDLETWRGKPFTEAEEDGFSVAKLLNVPCTLTIVHKKNQKGGISASVAGIAPIMKGMTCPPKVTRNIFFAMDPAKDRAANTVGNEGWADLPEWLQKKISESEDFKHEGLPPAGPALSLEEQQVAEKVAEVEAHVPAEPAEDDVPF